MLTGGAAWAHRPEIDGLRCIAVMSVILYHSSIGLVPGGFIGVDIFFVISGFLITGIIRRDINKGCFTFFAFYERRIRRIFPALFVVLALSIPAAWILLTPFQLKEFAQSIVATTLFASNIFFRIKSGYFSADAETLPLLHMWSLAVEEQFYIGFPVLLIIVHKIKAIPLNAVLVAGCLGSLAYCLYKQPIEPMGAFFLLPSRAWELALGSLVAINRVRMLEALEGRTATLRAIEALGLLMIAIPLVTYTNATPFPGIATIPPVLGSALLILASNGKGPVGAILASRLFVGIGLISYSAYLWHQPLFAFTRAASVTHIPAWGAVTLVAVTLICAYLSWRFVEQPFRSRDGVSRRMIYALSIGLSLLLIVVGLLGYARQGFPERYDAKVRALAATTIASPDRLRCHTDGINFRKPETACRYFGKNVDWALLGDSHSIETGHALAEHLAPSGHGLVHLNFSGCQPALLLKSPNAGCNAWLNQSMSLIERSPEIKNVFLVFRHSFYLFGDQTKTYPTVPDMVPNFAGNSSAVEAREAYWADYTALVTRLSRAGKRVYVVLPLPELPVHVDRYVYRDGGANAFTPIDYYARRNAFVLARMKTITAIPGVTVLNPRDAVCDAGKCRAIIDGESMYIDDNHFSMPAARRFIASQVKKGLLP